jgi:predicted metal-dependent phosphoesterase TrpH
MEFRADMHCHTTCSDGTLTPYEIVDLALNLGLSGLSITDHDTVEAYESVIEYAKEKGLELISGVEFSCLYRGKSIHILGYAFNTKNKDIKAYCLKHKERREKRFYAILELLARHDLPLTEEEVLQESHDGTIGRPHIALAMLKKGYIGSMEEAFKNYLGAGKKCFVPGEAFPVEETIRIIQNAGGVAVIAHPHLIKDSSTTKELLKMNFDGLEGYYSRFDKETNLRWVNVAKQKNWIITGGSDFHGAVKPHIPLGSSWVNKETFESLKHRYVQSQIR